uniref:Uncharacterized protein n=1 Tax=Pan paniscus TaxID=9597 RepID=A0A2R9BNW2_PANPA
MTSKYITSRTETVSKSPHISNCSVASDYLDLDKITKKDNGGIQGKRKAASKAAVQQRKIFLEGSDGNSANNTKPDLATGEDSEDDSDFGESEDNDKDSSMRKSKNLSPRQKRFIFLQMPLGNHYKYAVLQLKARDLNVAAIAAAHWQECP